MFSKYENRGGQEIGKLYRTRTPLIRSLLFLFIVFLFASCSKETNPNLKRGDEWIKMRDFARAESEFSQAVSNEPANLDAHIGLVKSLIGLSHYGDAVKEIGVVRKLERSSHTSAELSRMVENSILATFKNPSEIERRSYDLSNNLDLLRIVGTAQSIPFLKSCMESPAAEVAAKAESVLQGLSPSEIPATLDALLASPNIIVQERTAKRLWINGRSEKAGKILLRIAEAQMVTASNYHDTYEEADFQQGLGSMDELGYGLAKEFYNRVIISSEAYNWKLITICVQKVNEAHDVEMKDAVLGMMRKYKTEEPGKLMESNPQRAALEYLANVGDNTYVPHLKAALGFYFPSADQRYSPQIIALLAKMDGGKWNSFCYFYSQGGWGECTKLILDINKKRGDYGGSGQPVIDDSPADAASINSLFVVLGPWKILGSNRQLKVSRVDVLEADNMRWICSIEDPQSGNVISKPNLIFRGTGNPARAWVLTKVENILAK